MAQKVASGQSSFSLESRKVCFLIRSAQGQLSSIPTVQTQVFIPQVANHVPHLLITYDQNQLKITGAEVMQKMREGSPRIELNPSTGGAPASAGLPGGPNTIIVGVWMLQPGEERVVARCLRAVLQAAIRN